MRQTDVRRASSFNAPANNRQDFAIQYLQPDDQRSVAVSVSVSGTIQPVEHMCSGPYVDVTPKLRARVVSAAIGRLRADAIFSHNGLMSIVFVIITDSTINTPRH